MLLWMDAWKDSWASCRPPLRPEGDVMKSFMSDSRLSSCSASWSCSGSWSTQKSLWLLCCCSFFTGCSCSILLLPSSSPSSPSQCWDSAGKDWCCGAGGCWWGWWWCCSNRASRLLSRLDPGPQPEYNNSNTWFDWDARTLSWKAEAALNTNLIWEAAAASWADRFLNLWSDRFPLCTLQSSSPRLRISPPRPPPVSRWRKFEANACLDVLRAQSDACSCATRRVLARQSTSRLDCKHGRGSKPCWVW